MKAPICNCGIQMVERRNKTTSQLFYGCAKFGKGGCGETAEHEDTEFARVEDHTLLSDNELYGE